MSKHFERQISTASPAVEAPNAAFGEPRLHLVHVALARPDPLRVRDAAAVADRRDLVELPAGVDPRRRAVCRVLPVRWLAEGADARLTGERDVGAQAPGLFVLQNRQLAGQHGERRRRHDGSFEHDGASSRQDVVS